MDEATEAPNTSTETAATPAASAPAEGGGGPNFTTAVGPGQDGGAGDLDAEGAERKQAKPVKPQALKVKRGGAEVEATLEDLQRWASDDWEHVVKIDGEERKLRLPELTRYASMGGAALKRMQEATEFQKKLERDRAEFLKDKERYFAEAGEDPYEWAVSQVKNQMQLERLKTEDPDAYIEQMQARRMKQAEMKARFEQQRAEAQARAQQAAESRKALMGSVPGELERMGAGKYSRTMHGVLSQIMAQAEQGGARVDAAQLATLARDQFRADIRGALAGLDVGQLEDMLGPDVIKALRKADLERAKAADKARMLDGKQPESNTVRRSAQAASERKTTAQILAEHGWNGRG